MNLQNMAPNAKRSLLVTLALALAAAGIFFGAVEPAEAELKRLTQQRDELSTRHAIMRRNLAEADKTDVRYAACETNLAPFRAAMLEPLLESVAMRAKSVLDPLALAAGLAETDCEALPRIALPVPKRLPLQLHAREPIRVSTTGSYQAAVSFLLRVEREFPLTILQSLTIQTILGETDRQRIDFVFEWPAKGAKTK